MGRQIQALLRQMQMSTGHSGLQQTAALERTALEQLTEQLDEGVGADIPESAAEAVISEKLVVFQNIQVCHLIHVFCSIILLGIAISKSNSSSISESFIYQG